MNPICTVVVFGLGLAATLVAAEPETPQVPAIPIREVQRTDAVDFEREILLMLKNNCLACHNQTKAKADLILETPQTILKGGESGPAVLPGKGSESLLMQVASHQKKPLMPPRENKAAASNLTPEQLGLLKLWIDQGARGEVRTAAPLDWHPVPDALNPIYAVALSQDGQLAAASRANRIFVYHVPSKRLLTVLTDPKVTNDVEAAHRDLVQSLAFNPDATLLASGSYREVKLWRRPVNVRKSLFQLAETNSALALSADGKWIAVSLPDNSIELRETATRKLARTLTGHEKPVTSLKFSPSCHRLCSVSSDKSLRIWNVSDGTACASTNLTPEISAVTWLAGESQLASGGADHLVRIWRVPDSSSNALTLVKELSGHEDAVTALDTVPPGEGQIVSGSKDGAVRHWDVAKGETLRILKHEAAVTAIAVSGDGKRLVSADLTNAARLWNLEDGKLIAELKGDRYAQEAAAEAERALAVAAADVGHYKSSLEAAEKQNQTQSDRLKKAEEAFA
ncbi:MAG: hypothetical protein L0Y58_24120, partial [Verrucomicrobia subdivision 3 bacterium]|nr:hypothetical protein [Limisphaerales bacterium]